MSAEDPSYKLLATVNVNDCKVEILGGQDADGDHYLALRGANCDLEGEEPGLYYPVKRNQQGSPS